MARRVVGGLDPRSAQNFELVGEDEFHVFDIEEDAKIGEFVKSVGLQFQKGLGFYQLTKLELIQETKQVVWLQMATGRLYTGDYARAMLDLPFGRRGKRTDPGMAGYTPFVQCESWNRTLHAGSKFLYRSV